MAVKRRVRKATRSPAADMSYSREVLERVAHILVRTGHSPEALEREFHEVCARFNEPSRRWNPKELDYFADIPHVIAHWHADPEYLDSRGAPRPLPLRGRRPSLYALIRRVLPAEQPASVAESLARVKALRRRGGLYVPRARHFTYPDNIARIHGLTALLGMLRTVEHNVADRRKLAPILERAAVNPTFPASALPAFHRRLRALASEFLWTIDRDMRRQEVAKMGGARVRLGVGVFAFDNKSAGRVPLADIKTRSSPTVRSPRKT